MNHAERFHALMRFQPVDRLPVIEWATWWNLTLDRWAKEGMPAGLNQDGATDWWQLDPYRQRWYRSAALTLPAPKVQYGPRIRDMDDYLA
ncbi:MAG: hypothetical protein IT440_00910, partial [Phycisphaeraceae bacterium]|nr:hypothetical protein [Phycisphaeraceae bacterium]